MTNGFFGRNAPMITGLGLGLLSGATPQQGLARGATLGVQMQRNQLRDQIDRERLEMARQQFGLRQQESERQAAQRNAIAQAVNTGAGVFGTLDEGTRALLAANPSMATNVAQSAIAQQLAPPERMTPFQEATIDLKKRELNARNLEQQASGGFKDLKQRADVESGLRKEFSGLTKDYRKIRDSHERVKASAADPSPAGDLALIFNYMKMLDPGSVVREGEFATAQNAGGVPTRIRAIWNKAISGQGVTERQRKDFVDRANRLMRSQQGIFNRTRQRYERIGDRLGVDVLNVVPEATTGQAAGASATGGVAPPPPGFVVE